MIEPAAPAPPPIPDAPPVPRQYPLARLGFVASVITILACIIVALGEHDSGLIEKQTGTRPNRMLEMGARYAVGVRQLMKIAGQSTTALTGPMTEDLRRIASSGADALRITILEGWMADTWPSAVKWNQRAGTDAELKKDVDALAQLHAMKGRPESGTYQRLHRRHGWMAELARAQTLPADAPERQLVLDSAVRTAVTLIGGSMLGMAAAAAGLVILILALLRWWRKGTPFSLARVSPADGGILLEGFALYMALFIFLPGAVMSLPVALPRGVAYAAACMAVAFGLLWPRWRGMSKETWREALGLHAGAGVGREMIAGLLGWLAVLPILILGMVAASAISKATGTTPSHPIMDVFAGDAWARFGAVILAAVWAPISEEMMFRGLLFPALSARLRWILGTLLGAFIFAVIHPQGWAGVPAIMALAIAFSVLRLWRRSLIAPMTAHALNNGSISLLMLLM